MVSTNNDRSVKMKKKTKNTLSLWIMIISTIFIVFNNVGQSITLLDLPFSSTAQFWAGVFSLFSGIVWTLYLRGVLK